MGIFKALFNLGVDSAFDKQLERQNKKAKQNAYTQTGIEIKKAKKDGKYINGSKRYQQNVDINLKSAEKSNNKWRDFTKELFNK